MDLTGKQKRYLRGLAHHIKPVVIMGERGVTEGVLGKIEFELENHELIKVKVNEGPLSAKETAPKLVEGTGAHLVQIIGHTVVLYKRRAEEPEIKLPKA